MASSNQEAEAARLADQLAAEFGREQHGRTPLATAVDAPAARPSRTPWVIAAVSLLVVLVQIPSLRAALAPRSSLHAGVAIDDADAEACVDRLWEISALVQLGESAEAITHLPIFEPVTRAPYRVTRQGGTIVVECPNPVAHGLTSLRITDTAPMPEAAR